MFAGPVLRARQQEGDAATYRRQMNPPQPDKAGERPGFFEQLILRNNNMLVGQAIRSAYGNLTEDADQDGFNPYTFIKSDKGLSADPLIPLMVERGVFDGSRSQEQFWRDYADASMFFDDMERLERASWYTGAASFVTNMALDPANAIPLGVGSKFVQAGSLAARAGKVAAITGGAGLGFKLMANKLEPISNSPGMSDEAAATIMGAGLGALFTVALSPPPGATSGWLPNRKIKQMQADLDRLRSQEIPSTAGYQKVVAPTEAPPAAPKAAAGEQVSTLATGTVKTPDGSEVVTLGAKEVETAPPAPGPTPKTDLPIETPTTLKDWKATIGRFVPEEVLRPGQHGKNVRENPGENLIRIVRDTEADGGMDDYSRLMALIGHLDYEGDLAKRYTGGLSQIDAHQVRPGDQWELDDQWTFQVIDADGGTVTVRAMNHKSSIPIDAGESSPPETFHFSIPRDHPLPANVSSFKAQAFTPELRDVPDFAADVGAVSEAKATEEPKVSTLTPETSKRASWELSTIDYWKKKAAAGQDVPADVLAKYPEISGPQFAMGAASASELRPKLTLDQEYAVGVDFLKQALNETPAPNRPIAVLHRDGDEASVLLKQLRQKYDKAKERLHVIDHPAQAEYDLLKDATDLLAAAGEMSEATAADLESGYATTAANAVARQYARTQGAVTPLGRVANSTVGRLHNILRTLSSSMQTVTRGSAKDPWGFTSGTSAEAIKGVLEGAKDIAVIGMRRAYRLASQNGESRIDFAGLTFRARGDYGGFVKAVSEFYRLNHAAELGYTVPKTDGAHPAIVEGAEQARRYLSMMRARGEEVGLLGEATGARKWYLPRVYDTERVAADEFNFIERLAKEFYKADSIVEGSVVNVDDRPVRPEVIEKLDQKEMAKLVGMTAEDLAEEGGLEKFIDATSQLVEGDLPPDLLRVYDAELEAFYKRSARSAFEKLTAPHDRSGVADALDSRAKSDPVKNRVMQIDESAMSDYLVNDLETVLGRYHHVMGGRIAVRRAIQLNPGVWRGITLKDGTAVVDGPTLMQYLGETADVLKRFGRYQDKQAGVDPASLFSSTSKAEKLASRFVRDIGDPLNILEGRNPLGYDGRYQWASWTGRSLMKLSYLNKLGGMLWASMNDVAPVTLYMMQRPQTLAMLPKIMFGLKDLSRRELQAMNIGLDGLTRTRAVADVDSLYNRLGVGHGATRLATGAIEAGLDRGGDFLGHITGMHWWTRVLQEFSGLQVMDKLTEQSKRLIRARGLVEGGSNEGSALRAVGLSRYDAARLNKLGLNLERAKLYHEQVYKHGLMPDDSPISGAMSFDDYMASSRVFKPNFGEWDAADAGIRDLRDILFANINAEVTRTMVVQPGVFDKPLINNTVLGRLFNQFQTFGMAFVNQRLRVMAQMPAQHQLWYMMSYLALGAVSDAISNAISGRRSLDETARLWQEEPLSMMYAAWDRSGMAGWVGRPLSIMDAAGLPFSPGVLSGRVPETTANRHIQPGRALTWFGPAFADLDRSGRVLFDVAGGRADNRTAYEAWKLAPYQNWMGLRLLHQTTGVPVVPEALLDRGNNEPRP